MLVRNKVKDLFKVFMLSFDGEFNLRLSTNEGINSLQSKLFIFKVKPGLMTHVPGMTGIGWLLLRMFAIAFFSCL